MRLHLTVARSSSIIYNGFRVRAKCAVGLDADWQHTFGPPPPRHTAALRYRNDRFKPIWLPSHRLAFGSFETVG